MIKTIMKILAVPISGLILALISYFFKFDPIAAPYSKPDPWAGLMIIGILYFFFAYFLTRTPYALNNDFLYQYMRKRKGMENDLEDDKAIINGRMILIIDAILSGIVCILLYTLT